MAVGLLPSHLENRNCYAKLLFVDFRLAFNMVIPTKWIQKVLDLGLSPSLCNWILGLPRWQIRACSDRQEHLLILTLNTGALRASQQSGARTTTSLSKSTKNRTWLLTKGNREQSTHPSTSGRAAVKRINSFKFLEITLTSTLKWTECTTAAIKKAHQCLNFLKCLRKAWLSTPLLNNFYKCAVESILKGALTSW